MRSGTRCCVRARDRFSACRAGSEAVRRRPRPRRHARRDRILRVRSCGTGRAGCGARIRARTSRARRGSPAAVRRRRRSARSVRSRPTGATISRGRKTITSSANACRPALPTYSAQENSPVVRSSSATPTTGSDPDVLGSDVRTVPGSDPSTTESRNAGARSSRCCESVSVPGETTRTISRLTMPLAFFGSSTWSQIATRKPFLTRPCKIRVDGMVRYTAHRYRRALAVLRSRGQRQIQRARGHERVFVEHLVEITHPKKQDRVSILLLRIEVLPHGRRDAGCVSCGGGGTLSGVGM